MYTKGKRMNKTVDRPTWASLRKLNTAFLKWCAAAHEEATPQNLIRWLYLEDFGTDRDGWALTRIGYKPTGEAAEPPTGP
jgi:hypothetical protein